MNGLMWLKMPLLLFGEIVVLTTLLLYLMKRLDASRTFLDRGWILWTIVGYSLMVSLWTELFLKHWGMKGMLVLGMLAAYLLTAAIMDYQTKEVYDFLHLIGGVPGIYIITRMQWNPERFLSLGIFMLIQILFCIKFYGSADGAAFVVCALFESCFGIGLLTFLLHMLAVYVLLGCVQAFRHNINRKGNLKKEVAMIPYIAVTVWFFL